jgi:hypothetical protein
MKFVKALNSGVVTDLGLGQHIYSITTDGCEVEDDVATKLKDVFGYLIEVSDVSDAPVVEAPTPEAAPVEATPEVEPEVVAPTEVVETETVPEETPVEDEEVSA